MLSDLMDLDDAHRYVADMLAWFGQPA